MRLLSLGFCERIDDGRAQLGTHARMLIELGVEIADAIAQHGALIALERDELRALADASDYVGGHVDAALVFLPPSPAAILMLIVGKAVEAGLHLGLQICVVDMAGNLEAAEGFGDDDVGQIAGHGLLGAAVGVAGEVVECGEERAGDRGADLDAEASARRGPS